MVARRCEGAIAASKELGHVWLRMAQDLLRFAEIFVCSVESHSDRQAGRQAGQKNKRPYFALVTPGVLVCLLSRARQWEAQRRPRAWWNGWSLSDCGGGGAKNWMNREEGCTDSVAGSRMKRVTCFASLFGRDLLCRWEKCVCVIRRALV